MQTTFSRQTGIRWDLLLIFLGAVMLLATVFYPFGYDQAAFSVAGEMILKHGAVPYRDFLDTKPPIIFYIYSAAIALFGHHEWSIRVLDVALQSIGAFWLFRLLKIPFGRERALASAGLYLILYSSAGFWMTAQAEGFSTLASIALLASVLSITSPESRSRSQGVICGITLTVLLLLKFTLILGFAGVICYVFLERSIPLKRALQYLGYTLATFILCTALYLVVLWLQGGLQIFLQSIVWVSRYSSIDPLFSRGTLSGQFYQLFPLRLLTTISPILLSLSLWAVFRRMRDAARSDAEHQAENSLLLLLSLYAVWNLLGVISERKMFEYHYSRAFCAIAPLAVLGLYDVSATLHRIRERFRDQGLQRRIALAVMMVIATGAALFYSPLIRFGSQTISWAKISLSGGDANADVQIRYPDYFAHEQTVLGRYLKSKPGSIFFWGNDVGAYFFAHKLPTTFCLTATPFRTAWTPQSWESTLVSQIQSTRPEYFIVEFGDAKSYITGSTDDSYQSLQKIPDLRSVVAQSYRPDTTIGHFYIYRRRG